MKETERLAIVADAVAAFNGNDRARARQLCDKGLRELPADPALLHLSAAILLAEEDFPAARKRIEACLAVQPRNAPALILASRIDRAELRLEAALRRLDKAASIEARLEILVEKARILEQMGDKAAARDAWNAVLQAKPTFAEALKRLIFLAKERGDRAEAEQLLQRAAALEDHPGIWFELGLLRHDLKKLDGAAEAYRHVLELRAETPEAAVNLGVVLQEAGRMDEAMMAFSTAYRLDATTFGVIAMALTSAPCGRLWLDEEVLRRSLTSGAPTLGAKPFPVDTGR